MIVNKMNMDIFNNSFENRHTYKQTGFGEVGVFTGKSYLKKGKEDNFKVDKLLLDKILIKAMSLEDHLAKWNILVGYFSGLF